MTWQSASSDAPLRGLAGIVTGGGKGLGRAFALELAGAGAQLVVNNRNRQIDDDGRGPADHVVAQIRAAGGEAVAEHSDVTDPRAAQRMIDCALSAYGKVDFLVTSAAVSGPEMFHKTTAERFDAITATNVGGTAHIAAACAALMRPAGFGRIVLIASTAGLHGEPTASAYTASKGAIIALGRAIAVEGAARDVLTNIVLPYATTQMTDTGMHAAYRDLMTAEVVAPLVAALVARESTLNGEILVCGGGGLRVADAVEFATVHLPAELSPVALTELIQQSRAGRPRSYPTAQEAFVDFAGDIARVPS